MEKSLLWNMFCTFIILPMLIILKKFMHKKIDYYHLGKRDNLKVLNSKVRLKLFVSWKIALFLAGYTFKMEIVIFFHWNTISEKLLLAGHSFHFSYFYILKGCLQGQWWYYGIPKEGLVTQSSTSDEWSSPSKVI